VRSWHDVIERERITGLRGQFADPAERLFGEHLRSDTAVRAASWW